MASVPAMEPCAPGVKTSVTVQLPPAGIALQLLDSVYAAGTTETELTLTAPGPALVSVMTIGTELVCIDWPPKLAKAGFAVNVPTELVTMNCVSTGEVLAACVPLPA